MKCNLIPISTILSIISLPLLLPFLTMGLTVYIVGKKTKCQSAQKYGFNILVGTDQMANVILLGDPDMTISGRAGRVQRKKIWAKILCWALDKIETNHCEISAQKEADEGKDSIK